MNVVGVQAVLTVLRFNPEHAQTLWVQINKSHEKIRECMEYARQNSIRVERVNAKVFAQQFKEENHQGVALIIKSLPILSLEEVLAKADGKKNAALLILDGVSSPHNLGAIIRSAECANVIGIIIPKDHAVTVNTTVMKVSAGAFLFTPVVRVTNLKRAIVEVQEAGFWVLGADTAAKESLYKKKLTGKTAICLGAEDTGMRRLTAEACDDLFSIPMYGNTQSLNVSVAAGISLFEVVRQQRKL